MFAVLVTQINVDTVTIDQRLPITLCSETGSLPQLPVRTECSSRLGVDLERAQLPESVGIGNGSDKTAAETTAKKFCLQYPQLHQYGLSDTHNLRPSLRSLWLISRNTQEVSDERFFVRSRQ